jgi:hypothetical protein
MPTKLIERYYPGSVDVHEQRLLREKETAMSFFVSSPLEWEYILYKDKGIFFNLSNYIIEVHVCKSLDSEVAIIWSTEDNQIIIKNATKGYFSIDPEFGFPPGDYKFYVIIKERDTNERTTIDILYFSILAGPCSD